MIKPFLKWAGGKTKLYPTLKLNLAMDVIREGITYVEPFLGGGAMLFNLKRDFHFERCIVNDINPWLINSYLLIKDQPEALIAELALLEEEYLSAPSRKSYYLGMREEYNARPQGLHATPSSEDVRLGALFIALNHTCFNGLYRENKDGGFNVPHGRYKQPTICNASLIREVSAAIQNVEFCNGDYRGVMEFVKPDERCFFYFDPPYRPLSSSANFNDYNKSGFGDKQQEELADFCRDLDARGHLFMLSNSDSENPDGSNYFELLYEGFDFQRVYAPRYINAFADRRKSQSEVLIRNYR